VWADTLCINQGNNRERGHQVSFMNRICRHATQVPLYMSDDPDRGAEQVASLISEHASAEDWETGKAMTAVQTARSFRDIVAQIRAHVENQNTPCAYPVDQREGAVTLSLCAGLTTYLSAEENIEQHRANATTFFRLFATYTSKLQETKTPSIYTRKPRQTETLISFGLT
jgi:hypothetical protein